MKSSDFYGKDVLKLKLSVTALFSGYYPTFSASRLLLISAPSSRV